MYGANFYESDVRNFIQNMYQALSKCLSNWIKVNELEYLKNPSHLFVIGFLYMTFGPEAITLFEDFGHKLSLING